MSNELKDIRAALEHQMALFGDLVVVPASPDSDVPHSVLPPESSPEPSPESLPLPVAEQETVLQTAPEPQKEPVQNEPEATTATPATGDGVYERISALIPEDSPLRGMSSLEEVQT